MFKRLKPVTFSILCAILSMALVFTLIVKSDAATKLKMPTTIDVYKKNDEGNWVIYQTTTYTYSKKVDCTKTTRTRYDEEGKKKDTSTISLKYKYKKGKKVSATGKNTDKKRKYEHYEFKYDKSQRLSQIKSWHEDGYDLDKPHYDANGYISYIDKYTSNNEYYLENSNQTWTYDTILNGSTASSITVNGKDFDGYDISTRITHYDAKGLKTSYERKNSYKETYTYVMKNSLVVIRFTTVTFKNGSTEEYLTTYTYGSKTATTTKWYKMINEDERLVVHNLSYSSLYD